MNEYARVSTRVEFQFKKHQVLLHYVDYLTNFEEAFCIACIMKEINLIVYKIVISHHY